MAEGLDGLDAPLECLPGSEYDEGAFLYFLDVERSRANRSNHALRLLLVALESAPGQPVTMGTGTATRLFAGLRGTLRETDVLGWYRQDRVAGAVLSARTDRPGSETSRVIRKRVLEGLRGRLPSAIVRSLRIRVIELKTGLRHR